MNCDNYVGAVLLQKMRIYIYIYAWRGRIGGEAAEVDFDEKQVFIRPLFIIKIALVPRLATRHAKSRWEQRGISTLGFVSMERILVG